MSRRTFTNKQIKNLSKNKNVARCGDKSVRYSKDFKISALRQYNEEGLSAVGIFEAAGFDLSVIGIRKPNKLMHQWNRALGSQASVRRDGDNAGIAIKRIENRRKVKTLEAKVVYLEAENDFLAQLRAGKRK